MRFREVYASLFTGTQITPPVLIKNRESPILLIKDREALNVMPVVEQVFSTSFEYHHHDSVFSQEPNINKHDKPDDVQQAEAEIQSSVYRPLPSPLSLSLSACYSFVNLQFVSLPNLHPGW